MAFCTNCGHQFTSRFCPECGTPATQTTTPPSASTDGMTSSGIPPVAAPVAPPVAPPMTSSGIPPVAPPTFVEASPDPAPAAAPKYTQAPVPPMASRPVQGYAPPYGSGFPAGGSAAPVPRKPMKGWQVALMVVGIVVLSVIALGNLAAILLPSATESSSVEVNAGTDSSTIVSVEPESSAAATVAPVALTEEELTQMYSDPDAFKGRSVTLTGRISKDPELENGYYYFQMYADPTNLDRNTVVVCPSKGLTLAEDDYVGVTGVVVGEFKGFNAFWSIVSAPKIKASSVKKLSYLEAVHPTLRSVAVDKTSTQAGYRITVSRVEFAAQQTRVYVTVKNGGKATFSLYKYSSKALQAGKQYDYLSDYRADYPQVQDSLLPGAVTEGVLTFPAMKPASFQLYLVCMSTDWSENVDDVTLDIPVK